jgi:hypothetical protein
METKQELNSNEIKFMERMEKEILPNRNNIDMNTLKAVGSLVGISVNISCRTCAKAGGIDMVNHYGQLKPAYQLWCDKQKSYEDRIDVFVFPDAEVKNTPVDSLDEPGSIEISKLSKDTSKPIFDADGNLEKSKIKKA